MNDTVHIHRAHGGDDDFEVLVRSRLHELADHAPATVRAMDDIVVAPNQVGRRSPRRRAAGIGATIAALVGAVGITTVALNGAGSGGAGTPNEAVLLFVQAVEREDLLGMIDVLDPTEVPAIRAAAERGSSEARRVRLLDDGFRLNGVAGVDVSIADLALETEQIARGMAVVTATSGRVTTAFDPAAFPFGQAVREVLGDDTTASSAVTDFGQSGDVFLATVQRDGRWFVSIGYTIAEYARRAAEVEYPAEPVVPGPGFDSPQDAVTAFYRALAGFDFEGAMLTAAPGEGDPLFAYAPLWLPSAADLTVQIHDAGFRLDLSAIDYQVTGDGDRRTLLATSFVIDGTVPWADDDGVTIDPGADEVVTPPSPQPVRIQRADGCTTWSGPGADRFVQPDFAVATEAEFTQVGDDSWRSCGAAPLGVSALILSLTGGGLTELPRVATVQIDGRWYVSPLGTVATSVVDLLGDIPDGASLFDSVIAPYLYGTSRGMIEFGYVGRSGSDLEPGCTELFVIDAAGTITAVVDDPPPSLVRQCGLGYLPFEESTAPVPTESTEVAASVPTESTEVAASVPTESTGG